MNILEIERQILIYKGYIIACNIAIASLEQANNRVDDCKSTLQNAKDNFENGYKGGSDSLGSNKINTCSKDATSQGSSVSITIASLRSDIVEFEQKIRQLRAARSAEVARLAEVVKQEAAALEAVVQEKAKEVAEAVRAKAAETAEAAKTLGMLILK